MASSLGRALARIAAVALVSASTLCLSEGLASAEGKVAVVYRLRAMVATDDGLHAQTKLKKLSDKRTMEIEAQQAELARTRDDIEKQTRVLSRQALEKRMEDWQRRMVALQTDYVKYTEELKKKEAELIGPNSAIQRKMAAVIERLAKKSDYDIIIDGDATAYARRDLDLTQLAVQMYNAGDTGDAAPAVEKKDEKK